MINVQFQLIRSGARLPTKAHDSDSGWDLYAPADFEGVDILRVPLGLKMALPTGYEAQIRPRSGLAAQGIVAAFGTIDSGYRGELEVVLTSNHRTIYVSAGQRIAQLVFAPVIPATVERVLFVDDSTERGAGGFGSSGQ